MGLIGLLALLVIPSVSISGLAVGALAWRKWHLIPGSLIPPSAFWLSWKDTFRDGDALQVLPAAWAFGLTWSLAAHSVRRQLTA